MARVKSPKAVVTFASTADALAFEAVAAEHGLPGRIIPVPGEISAGCGMAWAVPVDACEELMAAVEMLGLAYEGLHEVEMY